MSAEEQQAQHQRERMDALCPLVMPDEEGVFERTTDGLVYRVLVPALAESACAVEVRAFMDEPVIGHGMRADSDEKRRLVWEQFGAEFSASCAANGYSVCCVDADSGRVVGCFWLRDFGLPLPDDFLQRFEGVPGMQRMLQMLIKTDAAYEKLRPDIGGREGVCMDMWMGAVHPDFRRRGIYKQVGRYAIGHLRALKAAGKVSYKYIISEDTGAYSQAAARAKGMVAVTQSAPYLEIYPTELEGLNPVHRCLTIHEYQL
jgi:ribosomal protein S18 acetylase RimI-like enzyme